MNYFIALLICVAAAAFEAVCAGRDPMGQLKATKQPSWSPPNWVWVLIGVAWYAICFWGLARLLSFWPDQRLPVLLLTALMLANASANIFSFRMKRLDLAFYFLFPYWLLLAAFCWTAWPMDRLTVSLFAIYAVYQVYAAFWGYYLWRLNAPTRTGSR
jgi:tryptophan-rich sensory protein